MGIGGWIGGWQVNQFALTTQYEALDMHLTFYKVYGSWGINFLTKTIDVQFSAFRDKELDQSSEM